MSGTHPDIDFGKISFPSDGLTIGKLRQTEPKLFASSDILALDRSFDGSNCGSMLYYERLAAQQTYDAALGLPNPDAERREELVDLLTSAYEDYGLSAGPHNTSELLREIESQAAKQAASHVGKVL